MLVIKLLNGFYFAVGDWRDSAITESISCNSVIVTNSKPRKRSSNWVLLEVASKQLEYGYNSVKVHKYELYASYCNV